MDYTEKLFSEHNYFGNVKILVIIQCDPKSIIPAKHYFDDTTTTNLDVNIDLEYPLKIIKTDQEKICQSIIHEISNHYGFIKYDVFDSEGNLK